MFFAGFASVKISNSPLVPAITRYFSPDHCCQAARLPTSCSWSCRAPETTGCRSLTPSQDSVPGTGRKPYNLEAWTPEIWIRYYLNFRHYDCTLQYLCVYIYIYVCVCIIYVTYIIYNIYHIIYNILYIIYNILYIIHI